MSSKSVDHRWLDSWTVEQFETRKVPMHDILTESLLYVGAGYDWELLDQVRKEGVRSFVYVDYHRE
jgi:hypothetical protein